MYTLRLEREYNVIFTEISFHKNHSNIFKSTKERDNEAKAWFHELKIWSEMYLLAQKLRIK